MNGFTYTFSNNRLSDGLTGVQLHPCDGDAGNSIFRFLGPAAADMAPLNIEQAVEKWINWGKSDDTNYNLWSAIQSVIWALEKEGQADLALSYLLKMLPFAPNYQAVYAINMEIGGLLKKVPRYGDTVACYKECLVKLPREPKIQYAIHNNMGFCLCMMNRNVEAEQSCRDAIRIIPDECHAYKNLGAALLGQLRFAEAAASFLSAIELASLGSPVKEVIEGFLTAVPQLTTETPEIVGKIRDLIHKAAPTVQGMPTREAAGGK
jgi:tetratricopeptide (TPR) repeat protein